MQGLLGLTTVIATIAIMLFGCYICVLGAMKIKSEKSIGAKDILVGVMTFFVGMIFCVIGVSVVNLLFIYVFNSCCQLR